MTVQDFMRTIIALAALLGALHAEPAKKPEPLTNEEKLALENLQLRSELLRATYQQTITAICARAGIPVASCQVDPQGGIVMAKPEPPKPEAPKK